MTTANGQTATGSLRPSDVLLSIVAIFALAVAQPLLDLLGRNAEFFLARAAPPIDIAFLAVLVAVVLPLLIGLLVVAAGSLNTRAGRVAHFGVLALLGGILALQVMLRTPLERLPGWVEIGIAATIGTLIAIAFYRYATLRTVFRVGAFAPLAIVGLFLFGSPASQLVFAGSAISEPASVTVDSPAPVVMVIFDEFPLASLMDAEGNIQEDVYPNFARLARDGTWFRNATTVQQQTERALPAILTGNDPGEDGGLPTANEYPANLFTLLAGSYDLHVRESVTELCPEFACENTSRPSLPLGSRWSALWSDLRVVAGHLFLPEDIADGLPPINQTWSNFTDRTDAEEFDIIARFQALEAADRRLPVAEFITAIEPPDGEPPLHFLHALLPHVPWSYLASGQAYPSPSPAPGSKSPGWGPDEWLVDQAYQQHLVQVMYVDTVVGELIERLEDTGLYDDALIVVMADHGVTVRPDIPHRRVAYESTIGDIAAVPLFIKQPNDPGHGVDDYRAETIDVLPTIADVLGIDPPWQTDGSSLFDADRPERTESQITGSEGVITFGTDGSEVRAVAARKVSHFGDHGPYGLAPDGHADLLGTRLVDLDIGPSDGISVTIRDEADYADVDVDGPWLPARVRGVVKGDVDDDLILGVAVNGEVVAVTRTFATDDGTTEYGALIPPESLVDGANTVELVLIRDSGAGRTIHSTAG